MGRHILLSLVLAAALTIGVFAISLIPTGPRDHGVVESIHGIPFPKADNRWYIEEELAHTDIYLGQPVLGKRLKVVATFVPHDLEHLTVGVRENSFWLSYPQVSLYQRDPRSEFNAVPEPLTQTITIPLTDKLQEPDQSIDMMFFATGADPAWELLGLDLSIQHATPTWPELKDYLRSVLKRERAL